MTYHHLKREYTIEKQSLYKDFTIGSKSLPFIMFGLDYWIKKRVDYLTCIEGAAIVSLL